MKEHCRLRRELDNAIAERARRRTRSERRWAKLEDRIWWLRRQIDLASRVSTERGLA